MTKKRKKGEGSWGKKTINGIEYHRYRKIYNGSTKEFYGRSVKEVKAKIEDFERTNMYIKKGEVQKQTFGEYLDNWFANVRVNEVEPSTYLRNKSTIKYNIENTTLYKTQMINVNSDLCQDLIKELSKKYSRSTISKAYVLLNLCFTYAFERGDIGENPIDKVKLPKESTLIKKKKEVKWLCIEDVNLLVKEADRINTKAFHIHGKIGERVYGNNAYYIILIMFTGLRIGELMALTWNDINIKKKTLTVDKARTKGLVKDERVVMIKEPKTPSSIRVIPLSDTAIYAIQKLEEASPNHTNDDLVVNNTSSERNIARTLKNMLNRAECSVESCGLHALRHTFGSMLLQKGVDLKTISILLGHSDITVTANIYLHISKEHAVNSVEVLNKVND